MLTSYVVYYLDLEPGTLLTVAIVLALVGAGGMALVLRPRPAPSSSELAGQARRHAAVVHATACALGVAAALALDVLSFHMGHTWRSHEDTTLKVLRAALGTAWPLLVGLTYLGVHALGAWRWPRPAGQLRRATLVPRDDPTPARLQRLALAWVGLTIAALVALLVVFATGGRLHAAVVLLPALIAVTAIALLAAARGVVAVVRDRVGLGGPPEHDAAARRLSAHRVLRGVQLILAATAAVHVFAIGTIHLSGMYELESVAVGYACLVIAGLILLTGVVAALLPAGRLRPRTPRAAGADPAHEPSPDHAAPRAAS